MALGWVCSHFCNLPKVFQIRLALRLFVPYLVSIWCRAVVQYFLEARCHRSQRIIAVRMRSQWFPEVFLQVQQCGLSAVVLLCFCGMATWLLFFFSTVINLGLFGIVFRLLAVHRVIRISVTGQKVSFCFYIR